MPVGSFENFFDPLKGTILNTQTNKKYSNFSRATLNETFTAKYNGVLPRTP